QPRPAPSPVAAVPQPVAAPAAPAAAPGGGSDALLAAFLAGAGLEPGDLPAAAAEETMRTLGAAFREMVQGLHENLLARSEIKSEFRLERTMIRPQENNPLKFSPTVDEALRALLKGGTGAYLPAVPAVREGFKDIKAHQIAVMAGMQTALTALLGRFDPHHLEKRLKRQSVLDSILPAARKAKYWELYEDMYKQIAEEAEDDFQSLFGREFAGAYESQVKKL
ncbi:MAG: type VI secretion system-associated FHA domain protein TagH, partial [Inquilinus sp.]|nr:type VI secretion system-associated FHA domain protein TagH [Inquilinus sp.]